MLAAFHAAKLYPTQHLLYQSLKALHFRVLKSAFTFRSIHNITNMSLDSVVQSLANQSIKPLATASHSATVSPSTWREALNANPSTPESFLLLNTLVYKPKTAKTAVPVPVVVFAREETEISSAALAKKFSLKELRLASPDLLAEFFSLDKDSCTSSLASSFLMLNVTNSVPSCAERDDFPQSPHGCRLLGHFIVVHLRRTCSLFQFHGFPFRAGHQSVSRSSRNRPDQGTGSRFSSIEGR